LPFVNQRDPARRRELDLVIVWRLDRWGRSLVDLVTTLQELAALKVGFVSLSEALDMTTPSGRALEGMLAVFAEFERDIPQRSSEGGNRTCSQGGKTARSNSDRGQTGSRIKALSKQGLSKSEIARRLAISRTLVRRLLE
jgi:putative DNA-invertase from lambdoid prophage Rac